jgi:hypothetical protein
LTRNNFAGPISQKEDFLDASGQACLTQSPKRRRRIGASRAGDDHVVVNNRDGQE